MFRKLLGKHTKTTFTRERYRTAIYRTGMIFRAEKLTVHTRHLQQTYSARETGVMQGLENTV